MEKIRYIAHRGLHDNNETIPENSIQAFKKALEKGYDIEIDIQILKDGNIIVFHDENLKRMTGKDKKVIESTYEEIKELKLANTEFEIPLFCEVLKLVDGKCLLDIELKNETFNMNLEKETSKILDEYSGEFWVKSFNPYSILWFKKNKPKYIRGQLASEFSDKKMNLIKKYLLKNMKFNIFTKPHFIAYDIDTYQEKLIKKQLKKGIKLITWTNRNKDQVKESIKIGSTGIVFECENKIF